MVHGLMQSIGLFRSWPLPKWDSLSPSFYLWGGDRDREKINFPFSIFPSAKLLFIAEIAKFSIFVFPCIPNINWVFHVCVLCKCLFLHCIDMLIFFLTPVISCKISEVCESMRYCFCLFNVNKSNKVYFFFLFILLLEHCFTSVRYSS